MDQRAVTAKGIKWLSEQKGPPGYQSKRGHLVIRAKGATWLSEQKRLLGYHSKKGSTGYLI